MSTQERERYWWTLCLAVLFGCSEDRASRTSLEQDADTGASQPDDDLGSETEAESSVDARDVDQGPDLDDSVADSRDVPDMQDNLPPTTPEVFVNTSAGESGPILCSLLVPSSDEGALEYTWYWQINQQESFSGEPELDRARVTNCDRIACWVEVSDGTHVVTSNYAEALLPFGPHCDDGNPCTDDSCAAGGGCTSKSRSGGCDDGDLCNGREICEDGVCVSASPAVDCSGVNPCIEPRCNPETGACDLLLPDASPCPDSDLCNGSEMCMGGQCVAGTPIDCSETGNPCLEDTCNPETGLCDIQVGDGTPCSSESTCVFGEVCEAGACIAATPSCECNVSDGLLLWYDFEGDLLDKSGNQRHGTPTGNVAYSPSPRGRGMVFGGATSVTVQSGRILGPTTQRARTFAFWGKFQGRPADNVGKQVINQYTHLEPAVSSFFVAARYDGSLGVAANGIGEVRTTYAATDTWNHWAMVISAGSNGIIVYRNGLEIAKGTLTLNANESPNETVLGFLPGLAGSGLYGEIDEMRVYGRVLSPSEIRQLALGECDTTNPGDPTRPSRSCLDIHTAQPEAPDGLYWIDPDGDGPISSVEAYCDMTTDGGGWTRVFGHKISNNVFAPSTGFGIAAGLIAAATETGHVEPPAIGGLMELIDAKELRFFCEKPAVGRRVNLKTDNSEVLAYLTGASDAMPLAAGTFVALPDDSSSLSRRPAEWGYDTRFRVGRWGHSGALPLQRLYHHPFFVETTVHWLLYTGRAECDDWVSTGNLNGVWHVLIR